jgi:hypothetical protein
VNEDDEWIPCAVTIASWLEKYGVNFHTIKAAVPHRFWHCKRRMIPVVIESRDGSDVAAAAYPQLRGLCRCLTYEGHEGSAGIERQRIHLQRRFRPNGSALACNMKTTLEPRRREYQKLSAGLPLNS